jgi:hypothetical protein
MKKLILALVLGLTAALLVAPPAYAWSCSDSYCHAISHRSPDDGYSNTIYVRCGTNMVQYALNVGQNSQAVGCNDVNAFHLYSGHSLNCYIQGGWIEVAENWTAENRWYNNYLGAFGDNTTYLCVDAWAGTIGGGQGGGGGGGGTW